MSSLLSRAVARRAPSPSLSDPAGPPPDPSPAATRELRSRWRDPRLALGVALVAGCALLGARLLAAADESVEVWAVAEARVAGQPIGAEELVVARVRFGSQETADGYLSADAAVPAGAVLLRDLGAGELLPRAAVAGTSASDLIELPVAVPAESVPVGLAVGAVVDVWVTPADAGEAVRVLAGVTVLAAPADAASLSPTAGTALLVGLDSAAQRDLPSALAALASGTPVVTRHAAP